jgi:hypothetical protein
LSSKKSVTLVPLILFSLMLATSLHARGRMAEPQKGSARQSSKARRGKRTVMRNRHTRLEAAGQTHLSRGLWGGEHVRLEVDEAGARVEFDCAHSTVNRAITLDGRSQFDFEGVYVSERGGPERPGQTQDRHTARYTGRVEGDRMFLSVTLTDVKQDLGTYTLERGADPVLFKCL